MLILTKYQGIGNSKGAFVLLLFGFNESCHLVFPKSVMSFGGSNVIILAKEEERTNHQ